MQVALTIAGSDSGGGAGIQADLKTFAAQGVFGTSVITAITAQNTTGVFGVAELSPEIIAQQFDAVCSDFEVRAAKTGMLSSVEIINIVAERVAHWNLQKLVVDPVMVAKGGDRLLREDATQALIEKILPLACVVTPNIPEAEVLCGFAIADADDAKKAAQAIWRKGARDGREFCVLVKGGHLGGDDATDILFDGHSFQQYPAPRIDSNHTHGTGCTFSAAIAAQLALGKSTFEAVGVAKEYITRAIEQAPQIGHGHGPLQHFPQT